MFWKTFCPKTGYQVSKDIHLAKATNMMNIQDKDGDINEVRLKDILAKSNACYKYDQVGHFYRDNPSCKMKMMRHLPQ